MEPVATIGGVRFVNDSKATNVDAAARSIESFDKVVAIVGGKLQGRRLRGSARSRCARTAARVVAIGEARPLVRAALEGRRAGRRGRRRWPRRCGARGTSRAPDGVVLLAPACSSFDMFATTRSAGAQFKEEVQKLVEAS